MYTLSSYSSYVLYLPSFLVLILASIVWFRKWRTPLNYLPPGPRSLPIIGHLHLLGPLPHQSFYNLSQFHGPLMHLRLGSVPLLVVSSSSIAREILQTHDVTFASRPHSSAAEYMVFDSTDIAFAPYGPYWRLMRQLCNTSIFSSKGLEAFTPTRAEEVALLVQSVYEDSITGKETHVVSKVMSAANNVISRELFGKPYTELVTVGQGPSQNVMAVLNDMLQLLGVFNVGDFIPSLQWMDLQGYVKRMKIVGKKLKLVFQEIIDARRELRRGESTAPKDLLDVLLFASQENKQDVAITDDNITAVLLDMFNAGTETSSVTVEWALAELLNNPTIMKKLKAELDTVVGSERLVKQSDIAGLPYLDAVVKETMRLHPPVPLLLPRESMKPCRVAGYDIPAKTRVFVNVWAISRDASEWERPLEFWPERFLESSIDVRGQHFQLLPFGAGRRGCPGWAVGLQNVQLMLASLIQGFDWHLPTTSKDGLVDMSENFVVTMRIASAIVTKATPRLSPHVYYAVPH